MVVAKGKQHEGNLIELSLVVGGGVKLESCSHVFVECIDVGGGDSGQQPQQVYLKPPFNPHNPLSNSSPS